VVRGRSRDRSGGLVNDQGYICYLMSRDVAEIRARFVMVESY